MGGFNRGGKTFGGKKSFGNDRGGGFKKFDRGDRPAMFKATCAECGRDCEVPFKPNGSKPVLCSNCFGKPEGGSRFDSRSAPRFGDKPMFRAVCDTCGRDCEVPFKPNGEKPVYCKDCFNKSDRPTLSKTPAQSESYAKQFEALNAKLDRIMALLSPAVIKKAEPTTEAKKESPAKAAAPAKKTVAKKAPAKKAAPKKPAAKKKK